MSSHVAVAGPPPQPPAEPAPPEPRRPRDHPRLWQALFIVPLVLLALWGYWRYLDPADWSDFQQVVLPGLASSGDSGDVILAEVARLAVAWIIVAIGMRVWLGGTCDVTHMRVRYVYVWLVGMALFAFVGPALLETLLPGLTATIRVLRERSALPVIWSVVVFLWLVYHGDRSRTAKSYLGQYRTVWTLISLMLALLILVDLAAYQTVRDRVDGLRASIADAQTELHDLVPPDGSNGTASSLDNAAFGLLSQIDAYSQNALYPGAPPQSDQSTDPPDVARKRMLDDITARVLQVRYWALVAETDARLALRLTDLPQATSSPQATAAPMATAIATVVSQATPAVASPVSTPVPGTQSGATVPVTATLSTTMGNTDQTRQWLVQPRQVIQQIVDTAAATLAGLDDADAEITRLRANPELPLDNLNRIAGTEVYLNAHEVAGQAPVAQTALASVSLPVAPIFIWVSVFYGLLLSIPATLLLLFFIRKRELRAAQILDDLSRLDPTQGLLMRALGLEHSQEEESIQEQRLRYAKDAVERRRLAYKERKPVNENDPDVRWIIDRIAQRAFSNMEYAIALTLLTGLFGLGWYFVFYPRATAGLATLIGGGAGVDQLTDYLAWPSPITFGFMGAYFWSFQMLLRRYRAGDLYPSAFLQASERVVLVFVISLVLSIMAALPDVVLIGGAAAVLAFVAGIFPEAALRQILNFANRTWRDARFPTSIQAVPLTLLDGIDIWTEARLVEEKIENIQSLATAPIEVLVLRTHFATTQIVDWIDQALLYLHAGNGGELFQPIRMSGVRTASDLLDAAGVLRPIPAEQGRFNPQQSPDPQLIARIAGAARLGLPPANAANASTNGAVAGSSTTSTPDPRDLTNNLYVMCDALWPDPNIQYVLWYLGYDLISDLKPDEHGTTTAAPAPVARPAADGQVAEPPVGVAHVGEPPVADQSAPADQSALA